MSAAGGDPAHPALRGFVKASGKAEVWEGGREGKAGELGWQTRTNESAYSSDTLIGNWNEERFDVTRLSQPKCLPSQVSRRRAHGLVNRPAEQI